MVNKLLKKRANIPLQCLLTRIFALSALLGMSSLGAQSSEIENTNNYISDTATLAVTIDNFVQGEREILGTQEEQNNYVYLSNSTQNDLSGPQGESVSVQPTDLAGSRVNFSLPQNLSTINEGSDKYLALRVNPSPEIVSSQKLTNKFNPLPMVEGGQVTGYAAELTPMLDELKSNAPTVMPTLGQYTLTELTGTEMAPSGTKTISFNGKRYYYTPNESTQDKANMLDYLAGSASLAITTTGASSTNYIFTDGTNYYTFDTTKLPESTYTLTTGSADNHDIVTYNVGAGGTLTPVYQNFAFKNSDITSHGTAQVSDGTSDNYDFKVSLPNREKYYNISINPNNMSSLGTKSIWTTSTAEDAAAAGFTFADNDSGLSNVVINGNTITGAIRMKSSHNSANPAWNRYYLYEYTAPNDYFVTQTRINNTIDADGANVQNKVFVGLNAYGGGAINNKQNLTDVDIISDFIGNSSSENGGAIYNESSGTIRNITGNFIGNHYNSTSSFSYGGAISNWGSINSITGDFIGNYISGTGSIIGGAIANRIGSIKEITGNFIGNYTYYRGGAIANEARINSITGDFIGNNAKSGGGALYNSGTISSVTGNFIGNTIIDSSDTYFGGAIYNYGTYSAKAQIGNITGDFIGNYSMGNGGAIGNYSGGSESSTIIGSISGDFIGNSAYYQGGAIINKRDSSSSNPVAIGSITGDFIGNYSSYSAGGAIANISYASGGGDTIIDSITGDFINNHARGNGGAIYNYEYFSAGTVKIKSITGNFIGNYINSSYKERYGGAIYNNDSIDNITGNFIGNFITNTKEQNFGGAIYNQSAVKTQITGNFIGNYIRTAGSSNRGGAINGDTTITGDLVGNYIDAAGSSNSGGAIYGSTTITGDLVGNYIDAAGSSNSGGAINGSTTITGDITGNYIKTTSANSASYDRGGAIYGTSNITNANILNNYIQTNGDTAQGGAIYTSGNTTLKADGSVAKNGGVSTISGNYISTDGGTTKNYEAIYFGSTSSTLTFNTLNNGKFIINDYINGTDNYKLSFTGDNTGTVNYNNIVHGNPNMTVNNVTFNWDTRNNAIQTSEINKLTLNKAISMALDVDTSGTPAIDTIALSGTGSSGTINITGLTDISGEKNAFSVPVITSTGSNSITLVLADAVKTAWDRDVEGTPRTYSDDIESSNEWGKIYYNHSVAQLEQYRLSVSGKTLNYTKTVIDGEDTMTPISDTMSLITQDAEGNATFNNEGTSDYTVGADLGELGGTSLSIDGAGYGIDGNNKSGITVGSGKTLNLTNVSEVSGFNGDFATNNSGTVNITAGTSDSTISDNITNTGTMSLLASANQTLTVASVTDNSTAAGTVYLGDNAHKGTVDLTGTLKTKDLIFNGGSLSLNQNNALDINTFTINGCDLDLITNAIETQSLGNLVLNNNLTLGLDVGLNPSEADTLTATTIDDNSTGSKILINAVNFTSDTNDTRFDVKISNDVLKDAIDLASTVTTTYGDGVTGKYRAARVISKDDGAYLHIGNLSYNLVTALRDTTPAERTYTLDWDENITEDITAIGDSSTSIGAIGDGTTTFNLIGAGYGINQDGKGGLSVAEGQTLNISGVGTYTRTGTDYTNYVYDIEKSWTGTAITTLEDHLIVNNGNMTITDSVFSDNTIRYTLPNSSNIYGGLIYNTSTGNISSITGLFANNEFTYSGGHPSSSGASVLYNMGKIDSINADFIGNFVSVISGNANTFGGAILNGASSYIKSVTGNFIGNNIYLGRDASGGALYNSGTIGKIEGIFYRNYTDGENASGAAISASTNSSILNVTADFIENFAYNHLLKSSGDGGAVNTTGDIYFKDSSFINNAAGKNGGAISIGYRGQVFIIADQKDVLFSGNTVGGTITKNVDGSYSVTGDDIELNDIHYLNNGYGLFLYAAEGKNITFNGSLTAYSDSKDISINRSSDKQSYLDDDYSIKTYTDNIATGGDYIFNNKLALSLSLYSGAKIKFGSFYYAPLDTTYYGHIDTTGKITVNSNVDAYMDFTNNHLDSNNFGAVNYGNSNLHLDIDANLKAETADTFTSSANVTGNRYPQYRVLIDSINNIATEANGKDSFEINVMNGDVKNYAMLANDLWTYADKDGKEYYVQYLKESGNLAFDEVLDSTTGEATTGYRLPYAYANSADIPTYGLDLHGDEVISRNLATITPTGDSFTIDGKGQYGIDMNGYTGFNVASGKTLIIKNVGERDAVSGEFINTDTKSIHGGIGTVGSTTLSAGVINNNGTVTITDTVFKDNKIITSDGGVIYNRAGGTMSIKDSAFINNSATGGGGQANGGGAIHNAGHITEISNTLFTGGTDMRATAIYNNGTIDRIVNTKFTGMNANNGVIYASSGFMGVYDSEITNNKTTNNILTGGYYNNVLFDNNIQTNSTTNNPLFDTAHRYDNSQITNNIAYNSIAKTNSGRKLAMFDTDVKNNIVDSTNGEGAIVLSFNAMARSGIIAAVDKDVEFTGNKFGTIVDNGDGTYSVEDGYTYRDIYITSVSNNINLNAATYDDNGVTKQRTLTFNGEIAGNNGTVYINSSESQSLYNPETRSNVNTSFAPYTGGEYHFNNTISGNNIYLYNGADVKLGAYNYTTGKEFGEDGFAVNAGDEVVYGTLSLGSDENAKDFVVGSTAPAGLSTITDHIETNTIGNVTLSNDLMWALDADLAGKAADKIISSDTITVGQSAAGSDYNIIINSIKLLSDISPDDDTPLSITVAQGAIIDYIRLSDDLADAEIQTENESYVVSYEVSGSVGVLSFDYAGLPSAVHSTRLDRTYKMRMDEIIDEALGLMGGATSSTVGDGATLTINGQSYEVIGSGYENVTVQQGQTLNINDVTDWSGFSTDLVVNDKGTLNISGSTISNNIANSGNMKITGNSTVNVVSKGTGTVTAATEIASTGTVNLGDSFTQNDLTITAGTVNVSAGDLHVTNGVSNAGTLNLTAGNLASAISGSNGILTINGAVTNTANKNISQKAINVVTGSLTSVADYLNATDGITNSANLYLAGGNLTSNISGTGTTTISDSLNLGSTISNSSLVVADAINITKDAGVLNVISTTINSGAVINAINNAATDLASSYDNINLGAVTLNSDANFRLDANLTAGSILADKINGTTTSTNKFLIDAITLVAGSNVKYTKALVADSGLKGNVALADGFTQTTFGSDVYKVSYDSSTGYITFNKDSISNLVTVSRDTETATRTYTLTADEDIAADLAVLGDTDNTKIGELGGTKLTVDGGVNRYGINGNGKEGWTVGSGQTLEIKNVGSYVAETGTITNSIYGFDTGTAPIVMVVPNGSLNIEDTVFSDGLNKSSIINYGETNISGSTFINKSSIVDLGGLIRNVNSNSVIDSITNSYFINNRGMNNTTVNGTAIYNDGTINTIDNVVFRGNKAQGSSYGAAICNYRAINTIKNSIFENNVASRGGAFYTNSSFSIPNIIDTNFTNNYATGMGAAIYAGSAYGIVNIIADQNDVTFSGNKSGVTYDFVNDVATGGVANDIWNAGSLNLKSKIGNTISFAGTVDGGTVYSNPLRNSVTIGGTYDDNGTEKTYDGTVIFHDSLLNHKDLNINSGTAQFENQISATNLTLNNAILKLSNNATNDTKGTIAVTNFTVSAEGATLDAQNGYVDDINLGALTLNEDLFFKVDAALAGSAPTADNLTATSLTNEDNHHIIINAINVLSDATLSVPVEVLVANDILKSAVKLSTTTPMSVAAVQPNSSYLVTYKTDNGKLRFEYGNLPTAVRQTADQRIYTMAVDEDLLVDLGTMGGATSSTAGAGASLTINGNGNSINGNGHKGVTVQQGQTLEISNVGSYTEVLDSENNPTGDVNITSSINGFISSSNGAVISGNNLSNITISDSVFANNTTSSSGGAIALQNGSSANIGGIFKNNIANGGNGGAILSQGLLTVSDGARFIGNSANNYGGAIFSTSLTTIGDNAQFIGNSANIYGGAIYSTSLTTIGDNAQFIGNSANNYGGAIYSTSLTTIGDNAQFIGNTALYSSAIYSNSKLVIGDNVKITDNSSSGYTVYASGPMIFGENAEIANNAGVLYGGNILYVADGFNFHNNVNKGSYHYGNIHVGYPTYIGKNAQIKDNYSTDWSSAIFMGNAIPVTIDSGSVISGNIYNNSANIDGAIYNYGILTLLDTTVENNISSNPYVGAIYNANGKTTNIIALDGNSTFTGNIAGATITEDSEGNPVVTEGTGTFNAINNRGTINLSAAAATATTPERKVVFNDAITSNSGNTKIAINNTYNYMTMSLDSNNNPVMKSDNPAPTGGSYVFNDSVSGLGVSLYNGANIKLGAFNHETGKAYGETGYTVSTTEGKQTYGIFDLTNNNFTVDTNGGLIDTINAHIDEQKLGTVNLGSSLNLAIDAALGSTPLADKFTGTAGTVNTNNLIISDINIYTDATTKYSRALVTDTLADLITLSTDSGQVYKTVTSVGGKTYQVTYDSGYLVFENQDVAHNLVTAVRDSRETLYTLTANEDIVADMDQLLDTDDKTKIGALAGTGRSFTIDGADGQYSIIGGNKGGIIVNSGQTLTIKDVGSYTPVLDDDGNPTGDITVTNSISGFTGTYIDTLGYKLGGAIYNEGTLNFDNVVFANNSAGLGGAIFNKSENQTITGVFKNNSANSGGAIHSTQNITIGDGSIFFGNHSVGSGGAIFATNSDIEIGDNVQFINNHIDNNSGGAVFADGDIVIGENAVFSGNNIDVASGQNNGGAVHSASGNIEVGAGATFINNETNAGVGGALSTAKSVAIADGTYTTDTDGNRTYTQYTRFENNSASSVGGAIYAGVSADIGDGTVFKGNTNANGNGAAIYISNSNGTVTLGDDVQFIENKALSNSFGGAIYTQGKLTAGDNILFQGNESSNMAGAIFAGQSAEIGDNAQFINNKSFGSAPGGAIFTGTLKLGNNSLFQNNQNNNSMGGAIFATTVQLGDNAEFNSNKGQNIIQASSSFYAGDGFNYHDNIATGSSFGSIQLNGANSYIGKNAQIKDNYGKGYASSIYNSGTGLVTVDSGSVISGNILNTTQANAGNIYNHGTMTLVDTTVSNNITNANSGAIYNDNRLNIIALDGNTTFTGNKAGATITEDTNGNPVVTDGTGTSNAIYSDGGSIYLNAGTYIDDESQTQSRKIIFNDAILGTTGTQIYINSAYDYMTQSINNEGTVVTKTDNHAPTAGTVEFDNNVTVGNVTVNGGTLKNTGTIVASQAFSVFNTTANVVNSGTITTAQGYNYGNFNNLGVFSSSNGYSNSGIIDNTGSFSSVHWGNSGTINNTGDGTVSGGLQNSATGIINSSASGLLSVIENAGTINLNGGTTNADIIAYNSSTTGKVSVDTGTTVTLKHSITSNIVELVEGATLALRNNGTVANVTSVVGKGGTIDLSGDSVISDNYINLSTIDLSQGSLRVKVDADLETLKADKITGTIKNASTVPVSNRILLNAINIIKDATGSIPTVVNVASDDVREFVKLDTTIASTPVQGINDSYLVTYATADGNLTFTYSNLATAVKSATTDKIYTIGGTAANEVATEDLLPMGGTSLAINGNGHGIDGGTHKGITVGNGQDLTLTSVVDVVNFEDDLFLTNNGTVNVNNTKISNNITNNNDLNFENTNILNAELNGTGDTVIKTGTTTFKDDVAQNSIEVKSSSSAIFEADIASDITNNGTVDIDGNIVYSNTISGAGALTLNNDFENAGTITQNDITVAATKTLTNDATKTITVNNTLTNGGEIANAGNLIINGDTSNNGTISGAGALNLNNDFENAGTITQNDITVAATKTLTNDATKTITVNNTLTNGGEIANAGNLIINGDTSNSGTISGAGALTLNNDFENAGTITQNDITVAATKTLTNDATKTITVNNTLTNGGEIANAGNLIINGDTSNNGTISGVGALNLNNDFENAGTITQNDITVAATKTLTNDATKSITVNNTLTNGGNIVNNGTFTVKGTNSLGDISGTGDLVLNGTITNNSGVSQNTVNVTGTLNNNTALIGAITNNANSEIISSADNLQGTINNSGTITLNGGTIQDNITGTNGKVTINSGNVILGKTIQNNTIELKDSTTLTINPTADISQSAMLAKGGTVDLANNGTHNTNFGNIDLSQGSMNLGIDADLANEVGDTLSGTVTQGTNNIVISAINIMSDAVDMPTDILLSDSDTIKERIILSDTVRILNHGPNSYLVSYSSGLGNLSFGFTGLKSAVNSTVDQRAYSMGQDEDVQDDLGSLGGTSLVINGNENDINGNNHDGIDLTGGQTLSINDVNSYNGFDTAVENNGGTLNVKDTAFENNGVDVINNGTMNLSGDNTFNSEIQGNGGTTNVTGGKTTVNDKITQNDINILSGGELEGNADNIKSLTGIDNDGTLSLTGGKITDTISGDGTTNIVGDTTNNTSITQDNVNIADGATFKNNNTVTTDNMNNNGTVDNNLNITADNILNNGNINNKGNLTVNNGLTNNGNISNSNNLTVNDLNNNGTLDNKGTTTLNGNSVNEGSITGGGTLNNNGTLNNTGTIIQNTIKNNGEIITGADKIEAKSGAIDNTGTITFNGGGTTKSNINGSASSVVNISTINPTDNVILNNRITGSTINANSGLLTFGAGADIMNAAALNLNGAGLSFIDNSLRDYNLGNVNVNALTPLSIDFDPMTLKADNFAASNITYNNGGIFYVENVNLLADRTLESYIQIHLGDATGLGREHVTSATKELPSIMSPIRRLSGHLENGYVTYSATGDGVKDFNPSIMVTPVANQISGAMTQLQTLNSGFYHMDRYTSYTSGQRRAAANINKYALADVDMSILPEDSPIPETSQAFWTKPFVTFESVNLKGGLGVDNVSYGTIFGGDSDLYDMPNGWQSVISGFIGYNGNHVNYEGVSLDQQGGSLGVTGTFYKGNFFTGVTVAAGASGGSASTNYGNEDFAMITAGVASKTGYNWEIKDGRFIIQPSIFVGYTMAHTFDYTNAAGARINSDPLHVIQVSPGVKFIGNLPKGWQPYADVNMVMNFNAGGKVKAANVRLPEVSVNPYIQYGIGLQKSWGERFTAYGQLMFRNGGRNGIVMSTGLRWTIGNNDKKDKTDKTVEDIKDSKHIIKQDKNIKPVSSKTEPVQVVPVPESVMEQNITLPVNTQTQQSVEIIVPAQNTSAENVTDTKVLDNVIEQNVNNSVGKEVKLISEPEKSVSNIAPEKVNIEQSPMGIEIVEPELNTARTRAAHNASSKTVVKSIKDNQKSRNLAKYEKYLKLVGEE